MISKNINNGNKSSSDLLVLGSFNSEYFWEDHNSAKLPYLVDSQVNRIITYLDEMLFVFCSKPSDTLLTSHPIDKNHKEYLNELDINFKNNDKPIIEGNRNSSDTNNIYNLLLNTPHKEYIKELVGTNKILSPYSVLPDSTEVCEFYKINDQIPSFEAVKRVNSKIYSHKLREEILNGEVHGHIIESSEELNRIGRILLNEGPFLIKEEYGVAGKGNIFVDSVNKLDSLTKHLRRQEDKKKKVTKLLLEPFLDKSIDFSCQFYIDKRGGIEILSFQIMNNQGLSFYGMIEAEKNFGTFLKCSDYFSIVTKVAEKLFDNGYFGYVCLDSMILKGGKVIPIVEINARKSMGLLNHHINKYLFRYSVLGKLLYYHLGINTVFEYKNFLNSLRKEGILFSKNYPFGILPLSPNSLTKGLNLEQQGKGRFYFSIISENIEQELYTLKKLNYVFKEFNIKNYSI